MAVDGLIENIGTIDYLCLSSIVGYVMPTKISLDVPHRIAWERN